MLTYILLGIFVVLQLADCYTTYSILNAGGKELNPVMKFFIDHLGLVAGLLAPKMIMSALVAYVTYIYTSPMVTTSLFLACMVYTWVVIHNFKQMKK